MSKQDRIEATPILEKYNVCGSRKEIWYVPREIHNELHCVVQGIPQLNGQLVAISDRGMALLIHNKTIPHIVHTDSLNLPTLF